VIPISKFHLPIMPTSKVIAIYIRRNPCSDLLYMGTRWYGECL